MSGTEMSIAVPRMEKKHASAPDCAPPSMSVTPGCFRQPIALVTTQNAAAGAGSKAHSLGRSGRLSINAAAAPSSAVSIELTAPRQMSGAAPNRCVTVVGSRLSASGTAIATRQPNHSRTCCPGDIRPRTGSRSRASLRMSRSCEVRRNHDFYSCREIALEAS